MVKKKSQNQVTSSSGQIVSASVAVVYHHKSGKIISVHHFGAVSGVELPSRVELERIALKQAALGGLDEKLLKVIHTTSDKLRKGVAYKVSPTRRVLSEIKKQGRRNLKPHTISR